MLRKKKNDEDGAIIIEFLVAIPIFILLIWGIINLVVFMYGNSNVNEAANEASRTIAGEMRGYSGTDIPSGAIEASKSRAQTSLHNNGFAKIFREGQNLTESYNNESECLSYLENIVEHRNVFCAYTAEYTSDAGNVHEQIVVRIQSDFNIIGSFIPSLDDVAFLGASSVEHKELPGRYDYID